MQQQQQGRRQLRGLGVPGEFFAEPQPQAPEAGAVLAGEHQAEGPAQQQDQVEPEQAAQRPEHIHRVQAIAHCGKGQAGAADHRQHRHYDQRQSCALQPVLEGCGQAIAFSQPQGPALNARRQITADAAGQPVGFKVFQGACVFFAQSVGFCQPGGIEFSHAASRRLIEL
ncbi:hypothetical protein D9M73_142560 [compost metagenome]